MMGANTQTVVRVEEVMAPATWLAPFTQAFFTDMPSLCSRKIFSITTMELSTSIPIPSARPDMEMIFSEIFEKYISTTANTTDSGIAHAMIRVGRKSRRNRISTRIARIAPIPIFCRMDFTIMSM